MNRRIHNMKSHSLTAPLIPRLLQVFALAAFGVILVPHNSSAQKLQNPSFETADLGKTGKPFVVGADASALITGWNFGVPAGVCRVGVAYAEGLEAAEGLQVAFVQGDPSQVAEQDPGTPKCVFGADITELSPGSEYEIQWAEASRISDAANGAITVILTSPANPSIRVVLAEAEPVENKGEWALRIISCDLAQAGERSSFPRKKRTRVRRFSKQEMPRALAIMRAV